MYVSNTILCLMSNVMKYNNENNTWPININANVIISLVIMANTIINNNDNIQ